MEVAPIRLYGSANSSGMNPEFQRRLANLFAAAPEEYRVHLGIYSGFRDQAKQDRLRADAVKKYGSEAAASRWVAKKSEHTAGFAADVGWDGAGLKGAPKEAIKWLHDNASDYGLHFPLSNENWHIEPVEVRASGKPIYDAVLKEYPGLQPIAGHPVPPADIQTADAGINQAFPRPMPSSIASGYADDSSPATVMPAALPAFRHPLVTPDLPQLFADGSHMSPAQVGELYPGNVMQPASPAPAKQQPSLADVLAGRSSAVHSTTSADAPDIYAGFGLPAAPSSASNYGQPPTTLAQTRAEQAMGRSRNPLAEVLGLDPGSTYGQPPVTQAQTMAEQRAGRQQPSSVASVDDTGSGPSWGELRNIFGTPGAVKTANGQAGTVALPPGVRPNVPSMDDPGNLQLFAPSSQSSTNAADVAPVPRNRPAFSIAPTPYNEPASLVADAFTNPDPAPSFSRSSSVAPTPHDYPLQALVAPTPMPSLRHPVIQSAPVNDAPQMLLASYTPSGAPLGERIPAASPLDTATAKLRSDLSQSDGIGDGIGSFGSFEDQMGIAPTPMPSIQHPVLKQASSAAPPRVALVPSSGTQKPAPVHAAPFTSSDPSPLEQLFGMTPLGQIVNAVQGKPTGGLLGMLLSGVINNPGRAAQMGTGFIPGYGSIPHQLNFPNAGQLTMTENNGAQVIGEHLNGSPRGRTVSGDPWFDSVRGL